MSLGHPLHTNLPAGSLRGRWRAIGRIVGKEWRELVRDRRVVLLVGLTLALLIAAILFGMKEMARVEAEHRVANAVDQGIWLAQGAKDPHAAAHFGQYAFIPVNVLALADPGVNAYLGSAIWLEAHKRNEEKFRAAREATLTARMGGLSLATVLQGVMPLVIILLGFSAFAAERERGTLCQLLASGIRPLDLLIGKACALGGILLSLLLPAFVIIAIGVFLLPHDHDAADRSDQLLRLLGLTLGYLLYLGGFLALSLAVSAHIRRAGTALTLLLAFWLLNVFLAPRLVTEWVASVEPLPTALEFRRAIAEDKKAQFGHDEKHPAFAAFKTGVLKQYGVDRIEDLPVNFRGLALRADDEAGYRIFDRHSAALHAKMNRQDEQRLRPGFILPFLAIQPYSMALAGSDRRHHEHFSSAAETHRRHIQSRVSDDLIRHGRYGDPTYTADPKLWQSIGGFHWPIPKANWALNAATDSLIALTLWMALTGFLALLSIRRLRVF